MNLTTQWMQSEWGKALGWTFVHSLWQIAAIGFLLYIILRLIPGRSAHIRYTVSTMSFWMIVMTVLSTFIIMLPEAKPIESFSGQVILVKIAGEYSTADRISMWLESRMPIMLSIWFGGVMILMARLAFSLAWVRHIRKSASALVEVQEIMDKLFFRLKLKISPLASESGLISSPVTIGHIKPVVLFPIGIINQLNPQEVEAILAHELAHIVRRDYLSNLVQTFIETLFYYHPVTWWISTMVRTERENRADDLAVSWCGDHLGYAKTLMAVQEMQVSHSPSLAIGFASRNGAMLARIQRILHLPYKNHNQMEKTVLISLCSIFFFGFTLNSHTHDIQQKDNTTETLGQINVTVHATDSIPSKGSYTIHKKTDNQDISIEVKDGDIKELHVDGKEINPSEYDQYDEIIDGLFNEMDTPPTAEGFNFTMPAMPPMPDVPSGMNGFVMPAIPPTPGTPSQNYSFYVMPSMPPIPDMPPMQALEELKKLKGFGLNDENLKELFDGNGNSYQIEMVDPLGKGQNFKFFGDSLFNGNSKMIIINDKDTSVIMGNGFNWSQGAPAITFDSDTWKQNQEEWAKHQEEWSHNYKEYAEQWKQEQEHMRDELEHMRDEQEMRKNEHARMRDENRMKKDTEVYGYGLNQKALDEALRAQELERHFSQGSNGDTRVYSFMAPSPRMGMTEEMIEEGLVEPGEEVEIVLTPDKLKINGKKMPSDVHEKYLRMYEDQQGVELSGNSRVEFKTKSHRSM